MLHQQPRFAASRPVVREDFVVRPKTVNAGLGEIEDNEKLLIGKKYRDVKKKEDSDLRTNWQSDPGSRNVQRQEG